jgi:hypothetical protein
MSRTLTHSPTQQIRLAELLGDIQRGDTRLWRSTIMMLVGFLVCMSLQFVDVRMINEISVWDKPAKFFLSLAVQFATVSWAMTLVPRPSGKGRRIDLALWLMLAAGWGEIAYILFRAARGEASHFNVSSINANIGYGLMGVGAVTLVVTAGFIGWHVWRERRTGLWAEAAGLGLMLGSLLGIVTGSYMSAQTGHWVGGIHSDAGGLAFFQWSTTGGDLRVGHFIGLHAMQVVPLSALGGLRVGVYATALAVTMLSLLAIYGAISGMPLFQL